MTEMGLYKEIKDLREEEQDRIISKKINCLEKDTKKETIGYIIETEQIEKIIEKEDTIKQEYLYEGFIPKGTKMVYGFYYYPSGHISDNGAYYFLKTDDYLYDFCHYISKQEIVDDFDFFLHVLKFMNQYFGLIKQKEREDIYKSIIDKNTSPLDLKQEHEFSWIKGTGSAMCTEYALLAQNILELFDISSYMMIGNIFQSGTSENHAFNIIPYTDEDGKPITLIIDFANQVCIYDMNFNIEKRAPYIGKIEEPVHKVIEEMVEEDKRIELADYDFYRIGNTLIKMKYKTNRVYSFSNEIIMDEVTKKR